MPTAIKPHPHSLVTQHPRVYLVAHCCGRNFRRWAFVGSPFNGSQEECHRCEKTLVWLNHAGLPVDIEQPAQIEDVRPEASDEAESPVRRRRASEDVPVRLTILDKLNQQAADLRAEHSRAGIARQCVIERDLTLLQQQIEALETR